MHRVCLPSLTEILVLTLLTHDMSPIQFNLFIVTFKEFRVLVLLYLIRYCMRTGGSVSLILKKLL